MRDWSSLVVSTGGHWCRTGSCVVGLVAAGAGRYSLVQKGSCWRRTGSCRCWKVVAGEGR